MRYVCDRVILMPNIGTLRVGFSYLFWERFNSGITVILSDAENHRPPSKEISRFSWPSLVFVWKTRRRRKFLVAAHVLIVRAILFERRPTSLLLGILFFGEYSQGYESVVADCLCLKSIMRFVISLPPMGLNTRHAEWMIKCVRCHSLSSGGFFHESEI